MFLPISANLEILDVNYQLLKKPVFSMVFYIFPQQPQKSSVMTPYRPHCHRSWKLPSFLWKLTNAQAQVMYILNKRKLLTMHIRRDEFPYSPCFLEKSCHFLLKVV